MTRCEQAVHCFSQNFNCAQAVLGVYCQELGLDKETALKLTSGFGGGMRCGEVCGAVSGAVMAIGLKYGFGTDKDPDKKAKTNEMVMKFHKLFSEENGTIICKDILTYDITKKEDMEIILKEDLFNTICPDMVASAVEILEDML